MISLPWKCRQDYFQIVRAASSSTEMYNYSLMKASWLYQLKILTLRVFLFFVCPNFYFLKVFYLTPRAPMTPQTFPLNLTLFFINIFMWLPLVVNVCWKKQKYCGDICVKLFLLSFYAVDAPRSLYEFAQNIISTKLWIVKSKHLSIYFCPFK